LTGFIRVIIVSIGLLFLVNPAAANEDRQWQGLFAKANLAYQEARFQEAAAGYQELIRSGYGAGALYYNLGNTYFRQDQLGRAILSYERARFFIPRDGDLKFNLRHAYLLVEDFIPESQGFESLSLFWLDSLRLDEVFWGFAILNVLFWFVLLLRLYFRADWNYYLFLALLVFWFLAGLSFGLKWYQVGNDHRAVVVEDEVNILAGPDPKDTVLFRLHAGTIAHYERSEDGWYLVTLPGEKRGWVKAEVIELIRK
jgi:tetratricopeptide (TPR) repeat protein